MGALKWLGIVTIVVVAFFVLSAMVVAVIEQARKGARAPTTSQFLAQRYHDVLEEIAKTDCLCDGVNPGCRTAPHLACEALGIEWPHPKGEQRRVGD